MEIKKFDDIGSIMDKDDEEKILDIFQYLDDEWNLNNIINGSGIRNINYYFINSTFFVNYRIFYDAYKYKKMVDIFQKNNLVFRPGYVQSEYIAFYFDLSGPNDFFRIRLKFIENLESMNSRILSEGYNSKILRDMHDSNHFLLYITK